MRAFVFIFLGALLATVHAKDSAAKILNLLPEGFKEFVRGEDYNFGDRQLGWSTSYQMAGLAVTVYVYDMGHEKIGAGIEDPVVKEGFKSAQAELERAKLAGYYSELTLISEGKAVYEGGFETLRARYKLVSEKAGGTKAFSEIHTFGVDGYIVKIRVTGEQDREEELSKVLKDFLPLLVKASRGK